MSFGINDFWTKEEYIAYEICVRQNYENLTPEAWEIVENALIKASPQPYKLHNGSAYCPTCGQLLLSEDLMPQAPYEDDNYCGYCGQHIVWD